MEQMEDAEREEPSCWLKMGGGGYLEVCAWLSIAIPLVAAGALN